ncbi:MAG: ABC transporter ATP-binding protein [Bacillota bacterium]|nr:ABC transporter ATP-binding protein [Bacillota bacterium]
MGFKQKVIQQIRPSLIREVVFSLLYTLCIALIPFMQKQLFDSVSSGTPNALYHLSGLYLLLVLGSAVFQYISQFNEWRTDQRFGIAAKDILFRAILGKASREFRTRGVGDYLTITNQNIQVIQEEYLASFVDIFKSILQIFIYTISLVVFVDYRIALSIIVASLVSVFVPKITAAELAKRRKRYQDALGRYTDVQNDFYLGQADLDSSSKTGVMRFHREILVQTEKEKLHFGRFKTFVNVINGFVMDLVSLTAFVMVGYLLFQKEISIGAGVATFAYIESFIYPIKYILNDINAINASRELVNEVCEIGEEGLARERDAKEKSRNCNVDRLTLVGLCYEADEFKLGPIDFEFVAGKKYLLVGPSGAGKTTLLKLISGQTEIHSGCILRNQEEITDWLDEFTSDQMMHVTQRSHIFTVPFHEQVTHFDAYSNQNLAHLLTVLPNAMSNRLIQCENCKELSGGEQQVLHLLTCAIGEKPIVLIDEGLSAIDTETKRIARNQIISSYPSQIYIEIAHDIDKGMVLHFDYVIEMRGGRLENVFTQSEYILEYFGE